MIVDAMTAGRAHARLLTDADVEDLRKAWRALPESDPLREVYDLAEDLSEGVFWAGWLQGLDLSLWNVLHDDPREWPEGRDSLKDNIVHVARLRALTIEADEPWFFIEDLDGTVLSRGCVARKAPLDECQRYFEKMQGRPPKPPFFIHPPRGARR